MTELRVCVGDVKKGRTYQKVLNEKESDYFKGLKIGEKVKGEGFGMSGYELLITGGSDDCGFPMRRGIDSVGRVKIYAKGGTGIKKGRKGDFKRKGVAGAVINRNTTQVNLKVLAYGKKSVAECFGVEEKKKEEKPKEIKEEKKEEVKKEETKKEEKIEEVKKEKKEENVSQKTEN